jgi:NAD(P)-dependent dehydrogenase (short-subunit alcohol dehydrogenase family)
MILDFKGKVALVTGAGSQIGFGKAIVLTFARYGSDVVACDIDLAGAEQTAAEAGALGCKSLAVKTDVSSSTEVNDMVKQVLAQFGKIDILVNVAGVSQTFKPFVESTQEEWDWIININIKGVFNCTRAVLPDMISRKSGKIINIGSGESNNPGPSMGGTVYGVTKHAVNAFTRGLSKEVIRSGINVNCIIPGFADTGLAANAPPGMLDRMAETLAIGRLTVPQDIANAVAFLASDAADDIVGQCLRVAGDV